jgi:hypothetical protein
MRASGPGPAAGAKPFAYRVLVSESNESVAHSGRKGRRKPGAAPPGNPRKPPLHARRILVRAARVARGDPWRILAVSIVLSSVSVIADTVAEHAADPHSTWQVIVAGVLTEGVGLLGTILLSGFLCRLTGQAGPGGPRVTLGHVVRTLPWGRLVLADLTVTVLTGIGLLALVIPGLIIANLLAVVGPLIEIEDRRLRAALRRSRRLVWPYFWKVAVVATIPLILVTEVESAGPEPHAVPEILEALAIRGVADGLLEAAVGLILCQLAHRLIALEPAAAAARRDQAAGAAGRR